MTRRVLFTDFYDFVGGGQQNLLSVFKALDRKRWQPLLALPREGAFADAARALKVPVFVTPMGKARWRLPWQAYPAMRRLRRLMREQSIDLVHSNDYPSHKLAVVAARGLGLPVVYHQQIAVTQSPRSTTGRLMRHHIAKADLVLAVSRNSREALAALGLPAAKLRLLYNNADTEALGRAKPVPPRRLRALGIPAGRPLLLAAGMRRPHKGFEVLLRALDLYYASGKVKAHSVLLGDTANAEPAHENQLKALAGAPGLQGHLSVLPAQRPFAPWLKSADLFVSSSYWEGSPLVVLEAMAAGKAILATRQGAGEVIEDGRSGWLVDAGDPEAMAQGLRVLMGDAGLRRRLGREARRQAVARFSLKSYVRDLAGHYDTLVGAGG
jgi:glycosyltransferase involved in cell wall biosynthesis